MSTAERDLERLSVWGDAVQSTVIDGLRVVHAESPGPLTAVLAFRVGMNDEPLPLRGITHLVEHLALHRFDALAHHKNGFVKGSTTEFVVSGAVDQVVDYLNGVCAALRDLPLDRLDTEKTVLKTEAQSRGAAAEDDLLAARFGAQGHARVAFKEFALDRVSSTEVADWARQWFVAENAVLWLSSDSIPEGLDVRLPSGDARPRDAVVGIERPRPLSVTGRPRVAIVDAVLPRSTTATVAVELMKAAVFRELRLEAGLSYTANASYEPLDADRARLVVMADATEENQGAVVGAMVDAIAGLRAGRIDDRDLDTALRTVRDGIARWREPGALAVVALNRLLFGEPITPAEQLEAEVAAITRDDLVAVVDEFWNDAIWLTPAGQLDWIGAHEIDYSGSVIDGRWFDYLGSREKFVLGDEGVSWVHPERTLTVLFSQCELLIAMADGGRVLVGHDNVTITLEPSVISGFGAAELAELDARVPEQLRVTYPARAADSIPKPPVAETGGKKRGFGAWALVVGILLGLIGLFFVPLVADYAGRIGEFDSDGEFIDVPLVISIAAIPTVFLALAGFFIGGWIRRGRRRVAA